MNPAALPSAFCTVPFMPVSQGSQSVLNITDITGLDHISSQWQEKQDSRFLALTETAPQAMPAMRLPAACLNRQENPSDAIVMAASLALVVGAAVALMPDMAMAGPGVTAETVKIVMENGPSWLQWCLVGSAALGMLAFGVNSLYGMFTKKNREPWNKKVEDMTSEDLLQTVKTAADEKKYGDADGIRFRQALLQRIEQIITIRSDILTTEIVEMLIQEKIMLTLNKNENRLLQLILRHVRNRPSLFTKKSVETLLDHLKLTLVRDRALLVLGMLFILLRKRPELFDTKTKVELAGYFYSKWVGESICVTADDVIKAANLSGTVNDIVKKFAREDYQKQLVNELLQSIKDSAEACLLSRTQAESRVVTEYEISALKLIVIKSEPHKATLAVSVPRLLKDFIRVAHILEKLRNELPSLKIRKADININGNLLLWVDGDTNAEQLKLAFVEVLKKAANDY